jgi:hypothetical protein
MTARNCSRRSFFRAAERSSGLFRMLRTLSTIARVCSVGTLATTGSVRRKREMPSNQAISIGKSFLFIDFNLLRRLLPRERITGVIHGFDCVEVFSSEAPAFVVNQIGKQVSDDVVNFLPITHGVNRFIG